MQKLQIAEGCGFESQEAQSCFASKETQTKNKMFLKDTA
jgi:hypothetical protein